MKPNASVSEDALRASEARYRVLIENAPVGILTIDKNGRILEVNSKLLEIMGSPSADATKAINMLDFAPLVDAGISDVFLRCMAEATVQTSELPYTSKWGKTSYLRIILTPLFDESGGVQGCQAVIEDVTDRRTAEGALRESEERFRSLFGNSLDAILLSVPDGRILMANPAASKMFDMTEEEILQGGRDGIVDTTDPRLKLALEERSRTGKFQGELNYKRKDGTVFPAEISSALFRDAKGEWKSTIIIRDVASRKRLEEAQKRLAIAVEQAAEAIVITDTAGNIQYVNPGFERVSGYTCDEALGKNPKLLQSGEHDRMFYENLWDTIKAGNVWTGRFTNKKKDGSIYHEDSTVSPVRDSDGKIVNFVAVKRDITENLELSRQLLQAQKMEAIGTLAGGIAHDFNNLLQITLGYSELLLSEKQEDDPEYADLSKILQSARSGAELVQRLLMFSRKVEPKPIPTNLNAQIVQVENILRRTIPKVIEIRLDLSGDLFNILADPAQIEQVLMNLAVNARDAMPEGGRLTLGTRNVTLNEEFCKLRHGTEPGEYVLLTVSDTGQGMDEGTIEHIFEPFYTTKELGRGTGLGLSMVYGIVRQHDGYVTCYSEVGRGTTFNVYFPAVESPDGGRSRTKRGI